MGDYITQADIEARHTASDVIALVDDEGDGSITAAGITRIAAAISDAEGEVNTVLSHGGLSVPLSSVPARVMTLTVVVAWHYLCRRRSVIPKRVQEGYEKALEDLKEIAKTGAVGSDGDDPSMVAGRLPRRDAPERRFTDDTMDGF